MDEPLLPPSDNSMQENTVRQELRKRFATWQIITGSVILLITCCLMSFCALATASPSHQSKGNDHNNSKITSTATIITTRGATPTAKATPIPTPTQVAVPPIFSATLGGPINAFDQHYGVETSHNSWDVLVNGNTIHLAVDTAHVEDSTDGKQRVYLVQFMADTPIDTQTLTQTMDGFLPRDAQHTGDTTTDANGPQVAHEYQSMQLAATFNARIFTNDAGTQTVAPGSLYWFCDTTGSTPFCYMAVGAP